MVFLPCSSPRVHSPRMRTPNLQREVVLVLQAETCDQEHRTLSYPILSKMADKFDLLEQNLEMFIENTRQMGIIVSDFQPQGQSVLNQKL